MGGKPGLIGSVIMLITVTRCLVLTEPGATVTGKGKAPKWVNKYRTGSGSDRVQVAKEYQAHGSASDSDRPRIQPRIFHVISDDGQQFFVRIDAEKRNSLN